MKRRNILLISIFLIYSAHVRAAEFNFSGKILNDTYFSTQGSSKTFEQLSLSTFLQGDLKVTDKFSARAIYQGDGFDGNNSNISAGYTQTTWRSRLREFYWEYSSESFLVREGKQVIAWGKSDGVNPTDYFSARDYSYLNPDDEARRISGTAVLMSITPDKGASPWTISVVTQFAFPQGKALVPPNLLPSNVTLSNSPDYAVTWDNTEYALKAAYAGKGWDFSLSGFRGFNHQPEYAESSRALSGTTVLIGLQPVYRHVSAIGFDASKSWSKWVARAEASYYKTENDDGTTALSIPSHFDSVVGVERPIGDEWRITGQVLIRTFPRYTAIDQTGGSDPVSIAINQQLATTNALLLQYQDRTRPSASLRVAYEPQNIDWSGDVFVIYSFAGGDYLIRPAVNYKPVDNLKLLLGADQYGGDASKPLGSLKAFNSVFFEAKYFF